MGFVEGIIIGKAYADSARARGDKFKVFDWNKAAQLIVERKAQRAYAGLEGDWDCTSGCIWSNGKPCGEYTYLCSLWAIPTLILDDDEIECWVYEDESEFHSDTKWPDSALEIVGAKREDIVSD